MPSVINADAAYPTFDVISAKIFGETITAGIGFL